MTASPTANAAGGAPPRGPKPALPRIAALAVLALTAVLIAVSVPVDLRRQRAVSLGGLEGEAAASGEVAVTRVAPGSPSARAGVRPGDVLVAVEGRALKDDPAAGRLLEGRAGTSVAVTVRTGDAGPRTLVIARSPEPGSVAERLGALGIGIETIIGCLVVLDVVVLLVYLGVAVVLLARGRGTALTAFAAAALALFGAAATTSMQVLANEPTAWGRLAAVLVPTGFAAAFTFLGFLYPNGRWVPRSGRLLAGLVWAWTAAQWVWPAARPGSWGPLPALAVYMLMIVAMFAAQVRRYRRAASPAEREQIKWFVLALATVVVGYALSQGAALAIQALGRRPGGAPCAVVLVLWQVSTLGYQIPYALLAVAIGLALLKHRLWDVDIVINKSLVYSALTTLLAVMSAIVLPLVNRLLAGLVGRVSSFLALAVTAAFPILAFNPLRMRLQRLVDRRMKPEDVTFDETADKLDLEVRALFPEEKLLATLLESVAAQLSLASAAVYAPGPGGKLVLAREAPDGSGSPPDLLLDGGTRDKLSGGQVVATEDSPDFSFLVPLVADRAAAGGLDGVLALGRRPDGRGYTTPLERGLRELGLQAGRALYVTRLREANRPAVEDRLDRLERAVASLKP